MKKIFAALLVGLMAVSVAACSNNNTNTNTGANSQPSVVAEESKLAEITKTDNTKDDYLTDTKLYNSFYAKTTEDNVRIKISGDMSINGSTMSVDVDMQKQGDNTYASMKMMGMNVINIKKDGYTYNLNSLTNTYTKTKNDETSDTSDNGMSEGITNITGSLKDVKFVENGVSSEEGTTDYEKYSMTGGTMTYYFNGDEIKYMDIEADTTSSKTSQTESSKTESSTEEQKMRINISVTNDIDATLFEIPEGYTEQTDDQVSVGEFSLADGVSLIEDTDE
ncbi:MAG: hypothetical protein PUG48_08835 [Clostridia bacterium]|nr:hypothetical protein [Clostridia bacterium]